MRRVLFLLALAAPSHVALAHGGDPNAPPGTIPCHLFCVTDTGRSVVRNEGPEIRRDRFAVRLETLYYDPTGTYTVGHQVGMPAGSSAWAVQLLDVFSWMPTDRLVVSAGIPWELNQSQGVVLPTLLPVDFSHTELAPGRIFAMVDWRVPVPDDFGSEPWLGVGYAYSNPIGTIAVADSLSSVPQIGMEALGVGSDDLIATGRLVARTSGLWQASVGGEFRLHMLPRWQVLYGTTAAWDAWVGRSAGSRFVAGLRAGGYRTVLPAVGTDQQSLLILLPTVGLDAGHGTRLWLGAGGPVPGVALNENSLQAGVVSVAVEVGF